MSPELSPRGTMAVLSSMLDKTHVFPGPIDEDGNKRPSEVQLCGFSGSAHGPCEGQAHEQTCMKMNNSIRGCSARTHPQIELQIQFLKKTHLLTIPFIVSPSASREAVHTRSPPNCAR